ncbi:hypothetical protein J7E70_33475, partial [Variovorax paradoxus]
RPTGARSAIMSKSIIWLIVVVVAVAAGSAYVYFSEKPPPLAEPVLRDPANQAPPSVSTPKPDHGNFQKRFQPSMPPMAEATEHDQGKGRACFSSSFGHGSTHN